MRSRLSLATLVVCLTAALLAPQAGGSSGMQLKPTATCAQAAVDELEATIEFVRGQTWTDRPGANPLTITPNLDACRVVLHVGQLTDEEEAALEAGGGPRLAIEYRRDWAKPSRLLLYLWVVFGGSGVVWVYLRYGRR